MHSTSNGVTTNANKALWEKGDFTRIAETMRESGELLVKRLDIEPGMKVLDVGGGDGTTAIPAAMLGARVRCIDIAANLVAAGKMRAEQAGLTELSFEEGDVTQLTAIDPASFDLVMSIFGAMFAPRPYDVAKELVRVAKTGGRIVMGNWIPGDPTLVAQILKISAAYAPPPPEGFVSPMLWGVEEEVKKRFVEAGISQDNISFERDTYYFNAPFSTVEFVNRFLTYYGPTMNAFEAASKNGKEEQLREELEQLFSSQNLSDEPDTLRIPATFLKVTVRK